MPANVRCTVSNCTYWDEANRCGADEILVSSDSMADAKSDVEIASMEETPTATSAETICKTFKPKGRQ